MDDCIGYCDKPDTIVCKWEWDCLECKWFRYKENEDVRYNEDKKRD